MKPRLVVLGSSGHAKAVIDVIEEQGEYGIAGCTSPDPAGEGVLGYRVLGTDDQLAELRRSGIRHAVVAIGDNRRRKLAAGAAIAAGLELVSAVSPAARVSRHASLGKGVVIMPGAIVCAGSSILDGVILNTGASVDHDCVIREFAHVGPGANLAGWVEVGEGAFLGIGAKVIPNRRIGAYAVVGAGAVVIRDVAGAQTVVGVPACPK